MHVISHYAIRAKSKYPPQKFRELARFGPPRVATLLSGGICRLRLHTPVFSILLIEQIIFNSLLCNEYQQIVKYRKVAEATPQQRNSRQKSFEWQPWCAKFPSPLFLCYHSA